MLTKGRFLNKKQWYSMCSVHQNTIDDNCTMCLHGEWCNIFITKIDNIIFKVSPKIWCKYFGPKEFNIEKLNILKIKRIEKLKKINNDSRRNL